MIFNTIFQVRGKKISLSYPFLPNFACVFVSADPGADYLIIIGPWRIQILIQGWIGSEIRGDEFTMQSGEKRVGYLGKQQEAHSDMDGCLLVLNSLDFRPSVMHQCQDQPCLICHERKHKNNRPTISYIFAFCIHAERSQLRNSKLTFILCSICEYVQFHQERLKMFRLFFLMTLAIFLAVSYGTSQTNSSNQVTLQRTKF